MRWVPQSLICFCVLSLRWRFMWGRSITSSHVGAHLSLKCHHSWLSETPFYAPPLECGGSLPLWQSPTMAAGEVSPAWWETSCHSHQESPLAISNGQWIYLLFIIPLPTWNAQVHMDHSHLEVGSNNILLRWFGNACFYIMAVIKIGLSDMIGFMLNNTHNFTEKLQYIYKHIHWFKLHPTIMYSM